MNADKGVPGERTGESRGETGFVLGTRGRHGSRLLASPSPSPGARWFLSTRRRDFIVTSSDGKSGVLAAALRGL
jgi:hypothetical protein